MAKRTKAIKAPKTSRKRSRPDESEVAADAGAGVAEPEVEETEETEEDSFTGDDEEEDEDLEEDTDNEDDDEESDDDAFNQTTHVYDGTPLPVKVGDVFTLKSNPGAAVVVTPELLEELVRKGKALP